MPDEMKMTPEEFADMRAQAAAISQQDFHLGKFLTNLLGHLGHSHGLDAAQEDARLAAEARVKQRADEDAVLKTAADERAKTRLLEDSQTLLPAQMNARDAVRAIEDAQLKDDADALQKKRDDEDAATKASQAEAKQTTAPADASAKAPKTKSTNNDSGMTPAKGV